MLFGNYKRSEASMLAFPSYPVFLVQGDIWGTLSRLESAPKLKSAYGTGSVRLGLEPASTMAPSRFRVGVAATLASVLPWISSHSVEFFLAMPT